MNFEFLKPLVMIRPFYVYCTDAEEFALTKPDISCASARKAIEYLGIQLALCRTLNTQKTPVHKPYKLQQCPTAFRI